ncbi:MAG TPA: hypothetical protein VF595_10160, partial [Tepidisphaeraceae bacterium]
MRRLLAILSCWAVLVSLASAQAPVTQSVTQPVTQPATDATPSSATLPTTSSDAVVTSPASASTTTASQPVLSEAEQAAAEAKAVAERRAAEERTEAERVARREERARFIESRNALAADADVAAKELATLTNRLVGYVGQTDVLVAAFTTRQAEIEARLAENAGLLAGVPTLETLAQQRHSLEEDLQQLDDWANELKERYARVQEGRNRLRELETQWTARRSELEREVQAATRPTTRTSTRPASTRVSAETLSPLVSRVETLVRQIEDLTEAHRTERRRNTDDLQIKISALRLRVADALTAVNAEQQRARDRLFSRDSPPLWVSLLHPMSQGNVTEQGRNSLIAQLDALENYVRHNPQPFVFHGLGVAVLAATLIWLRKRTRQWTAGDENLLAATRVFQTPIATAITASMILTPWIYIAAPRLFWGLFGTAALLPTIVVLRPLIERSLRPLLYGLALAIFVNLLLSVVAALPLVYRALQLGQMGGATVFFLWFLRTRRGVEGDPARPPLRRPVILGARLGLAITIIASLANIFGFVGLARLIGNALLTSAYLGVLLDTIVHVFDALLLGLSHVQPISGLGMVQRHRPLLLGRLHLVLTLLAVLLWGFFTLEAISIRQPVFDAA